MCPPKAPKIKYPDPPATTTTSNGDGDGGGDDNSNPPPVTPPPPPAPPPVIMPPAPAPPPALTDPVAAGAKAEDATRLRKKASKRKTLQQQSKGLGELRIKPTFLEGNTPSSTVGTGGKSRKKGALNIPKG